MAKHKDQTPTKPPAASRKDPKDPKAKPSSAGGIRGAVAKAGPARLARRITRPRRVTFAPATFRIAGPL